jgi:hypothetical protein
MVRGGVARSWWRRPALVICGLVVAACVLPTGIEYEGRRPLDAPPEYRTWYAEVATCWRARGVLIGRGFAQAQWFVASQVYAHGYERAGAIELPDAITMSEVQVMRRRSVKHEMSHHYVQRGNELHLADESVPCEDAPALEDA